MRILEINNRPENAISFYRSRMPWNYIQKEYDDIIVNTKRAEDIFGWDTLTGYDVIFITNPRIAKHLDIIRVAKNLGVKTWIDYDDCYLDIPQDNTAYNIHIAGHVNHVVKDCLIESDIITVTTDYLKDTYKDYSARIRVIPNAFPIEIIPASFGYVHPGLHNFVFWRGSDSHKRNLREFSKELTGVANDNMTWLFKFMGLNPEFFEGHFEYNHYGFTDLFDCFYKMKQFSSKIHIVTLVDRPFNRSKSNIAWIEATLAGSVVLAPNWPEWQQPGIVNYETKEDFKDKLSDLINGKYNLARHFEESRNHIFNNLSLKDINKERLKILQELCVHSGDDRA